MRSLHSLLAHLFHPQRSNNHRARILHPEVLGVLVAFMCITIGVAQYGSHNKDFLGSILGYASDITVDKVVAATNAERAKYGLAPLQYNPTLSAAALAKGQDMFNNQYWAHTSPTGKEPWAFIQDAGYVYQVAGENLARDFMTTPDMLLAWMASPTHKANIVNARYEDIGVAVINGNLSGIDTTLVVQMFGKQRVTAKQPEVLSVAEAVAAEPANTQVTPAPLEKPVEKPEVESPLESEPVAYEQTVVQSSDVFESTRLSPLQLTKAIVLSVIMLLVVVLILDVVVMRSRNSARVVGKNLAHIIFLVTIGILIMLFKGGVIG